MNKCVSQNFLTSYKAVVRNKASFAFGSILQKKSFSLNSYFKQWKPSILNCMYFVRMLRAVKLITLSANFTKWSNTLKQFADEFANCWRIDWVCLTILWHWRLKGYTWTILSVVTFHQQNIAHEFVQRQHINSDQLYEEYCSNFIYSL